MVESRLVIVGAGELGLQLLNLANNSLEKFHIVGFFDDTKDLGDRVSEIPIIGHLNEIESLYENGFYDKLVIAIGYKNMNLRESLLMRFDKRIPFATLIHKSCLINSTANILEGSVLYPGCIIDKNVNIGRNVLLNLGVTVAHDTSIGDNSFVAPRVAVSGFVKIGKNCFIGTNATIIDNIIIGDNVQIGAGSVLIKTIGNGLRVFGNPAKERKYD